MLSLVRPHRRTAVGASAVLVTLVVYVACGDDEAPPGPEPPGAPTVQVSTVADTVTVTWSLVTGATSYRAEINTNPDTLLKMLGASETSAVFTRADGVEDDVVYSATVYAINDGGETANSSPPTVLTDFFPWDEFFPTSLHVTGQGKQTFYNMDPNRGFERFTNIAYAELSCRNCHEPSATGECAACHDSDTPTLGATVDASLTGVCGPCHGRQRAEAITQGYSDVHRDAGMDCMECHSSEDVHGDGTSYNSMLETGAIDADCATCHPSPADNTYHSIHSSTVDCSACHIQSVVTCNNCHFETEVQLDQKKAYGQFKDWIFLVNYNGKVHAANYQSVKYGNNTFVAMAPLYAHTIARNARTCTDCHNNTAVQDYVDDGVIDVVTWDPNTSSLSHIEGVVPVPPDYLTALRFDFVDLDEPGGSVWSFLKTGADTIQMPYGTPLTAEQMQRLQQ